MAQGGRPRRFTLAIVAFVAVLVVAGIGGLVWAFIAANDNDDAAVDASPTDQRGRGVWILDPETNEAEFVPFDGYVGRAKWVDDEKTFIAQEGLRHWGLYNIDGKLLRTIVELPTEIRPGVNLTVNYQAEPVPGTDDILLTRNSEQGFEGSRAWTLFNLQTGEDRPLPEFLRDAVLLAYSPDGSKVAYLHRNAFTWDLVVANEDGSDISIVASGPLEDFPNPEWSPDSSQLLIRTVDVAMVIDLQGEEAWTSPSDSRMGYIWVAPGELLAISNSPGDDGELRRTAVGIIDVESGESQPIEESDIPSLVGQPFFSPDGNYVITQRRNEQRDFIGFVTDLGLDGGPPSTTPMPPEIALPAIVDWTADSSTALLSSP